MLTQKIVNQWKYNGKIEMYHGFSSVVVIVAFAMLRKGRAFIKKKKQKNS